MTETWTQPAPVTSHKLADDWIYIKEDLQYLMACNGYWVDASESDQGAAGSGNSVKDLVDSLGTT